MATLAAPRAAVLGGAGTSGPSRRRAPRPSVDTPTTLTGLLTLIAVLCVLAGTLGAVVSARSAGAARQLSQTTALAEVGASTVYTSIADADATAATAFLAGGLEPPTLRSRYETDISLAGSALATIGVPPGNTAAAQALSDLSSRLPVYTGLIETARANNRQGYPVGGAYLSTASDLAQNTLLTDADTVLRYEQSRVATGYARARSNGMTALLLGALVLLGVALVSGQWLLTRRTRRVVNLPLALATLLMLAALIVAGVVIGTARDRLDTGASASTQIALLTSAQSDALEEKGAESLTLAGRGDDSHEPQFTAAAAQLAGKNGLLDRAVEHATDYQDMTLLSDAARQQQLYVLDHTAVTIATENGDFPGSATAQAAGAVPFAALISDLQTVSADRQRTFGQQVSSTTGPLDALAFVIPILAALALLLSGLGIRLRLREFR